MVVVVFVVVVAVVVGVVVAAAFGGGGCRDGDVGVTCGSDRAQTSAHVWPHLMGSLSSTTKVDRSLKANPLRIRVCMEVHAESQSTAWQHRLP